ncbi:anti-sigma factor family protein [Dryocola sp. BD586]|uniref:anti-sigma factor family protein n=1 Tax=Dryocola sp. BD586 TaxID=3133271 RepID=UPI003F4FA1E2
MTLPPDENDLHAWMDGEADEATSMRVERYLKENPQAAAQVAGWRDDMRQLRQAMNRQALSFDTPQPQYLRRRVRQQKRWRLATACTLVLALSLGSYAGWQMKEAELLSHQPMEDAVQAYKLFDNDLLTPMDVVADKQPELARWLARYFINGNLPPNFEHYGFSFSGARLIATAQGPAALILYQDLQGTRIGWYIRPLSPVKLPHGQRQAQELMAQYWSDEHYNYALVTPLNSSAVNELRKAVSLATG